MTDLIKRLRATRERALWTQIEGFNPVRQKVSTLINPDGPEAADEIERLRAEVEKLHGALRAAPSPVQQADMDWAVQGEIDQLRAELDQYKGAVRRGCGAHVDEHGFYPCQYLTNIKTVYETPNCAVKDE